MLFKFRIKLTRADLLSSTEATYPEGGELFEMKQKKMNPKTLNNTSRRKVSSFSENLSPSDDDFENVEYITPDNQSSNENCSGCVTFLLENSDEFWERLQLLLQGKQGRNDPKNWETNLLVFLRNC